MPVDFDTSKSFQDLIIEFADTVGLAYHGADGDEAAQVPDNAIDLAKCKRYVNAGYKLFLRSDANWTFCLAPFTLTMNQDGTGPFNIDGEADRYALPPYLRGHPRGNWRYKDDTTHRSQIVCRDEHSVLRMRQCNETTGAPAFAAIRRRPAAAGAPIDGPSSYHEVVFYPRPDTSYEVEADFRVVPYDLIELEERHVAGADHDHSILAAALHLWKQDDSDDPDEKERYRAEWAAALAYSQNLDNANRPKNRGKMHDPGIHRVEPRTRARGLVTQINGQPIP